MGEQAVDAFGCDFEAHLGGTLQAFGLGVDANHPGRLEERATLQFVQQVGTDVAGTDQRAFDLLCHGSLFLLKIVQQIVGTMPPSTRSAAPVVAAARGLQT